MLHPIHKFAISTVQTFNYCTSRPDVCQCLVVKKAMLSCQENNRHPSKTHVACESKLRSVIRSATHPSQGNCVAIWHTVVYYAGLPAHLVQELNIGTVAPLTFVLGGLFHDCAVHDIDLVCWYLSEYPESVYSQAHCFNKDIKAMDDVDTVAIVMKFPSGILATLNLSRNSNYGYDQRSEVRSLCI